MPEACATGPVNLRHVHGRADTTVPLAGRAIGSHARQGDILKGFAVWRAEDRCKEPPDRRTAEGKLDCEVWSACGTGGALQLCLDPGDHEIQAAWLDGQPALGHWRFPPARPAL